LLSFFKAFFSKLFDRSLAAGLLDWIFCFEGVFFSVN
jgi:hypothetical protein